jgi:hypothetical protein
MTISVPSLVSAPRGPWRKSARTKGSMSFYFDETRAGDGEPFLKSVPVHAIDLRQIEPSYKVRLPWVIYSVSQTGRRMMSRLNRRVPASMPKRSREELLASLRENLAARSNSIATRHEQQPGELFPRRVPVQFQTVLQHLNRRFKRSS